MAAQAETPASETPVAEPEKSTGEQSGGDRGAFVERPELFVGAAFVGGFALAKLLKRMGR